VAAAWVRGRLHSGRVRGSVGLVASVAAMNIALVILCFVVGAFVGATLAVVLVAALIGGAREDRVRGEYLMFEDLGREKSGA
jgi:hypothetical protein